jgi:hypothetical protein
MACPTGRCALRRFDGHGSGSYRPSNTALASENEARLAALRAERDKLDAICFGSGSGFANDANANASGKSLALPLALAEPLAKPEMPLAKCQPQTPWQIPKASDWQKPTSFPK